MALREQDRTGAMKQYKVRDLVVRRGEESYPYSAGTVVEALQSAGVPTEDAMDLTRDVERRLRAGGAREVELQQLRQLLAAEVRKHTGEDAEQRFMRQTPPFVPLLVGQRGEAADPQAADLLPREDGPRLQGGQRGGRSGGAGYKGGRPRAGAA